MTRQSLAFVLAALLPTAAWSQLLANVKVEPALATPGEAVRITVHFDVSGGVNCGLRLHFGDGQTQDFKINQAKDVPLVVTRQYAQPGELRIVAEGKTQGLVSKCGGKNQETTLKVSAPVSAPAPVTATAAAPAVSARAAPKTAGPQCPPDWTLEAKSVNKKTGAFTCSAKAGTKLPEGKLTCPGELGYFENAAKRQLGCRP